MSAPCADLDPFFDGELSTAEAGTFRVHLASCERCEAALRGRMQEEVVAGAKDEHAEQPHMTAVEPAHFDARRRRIVILAPLLAAAAAFVIWFVASPEHEPTKPIEPRRIAIQGVFPMEDGSSTRGMHVAEQVKPIEVSLTIEPHGVAMRGGSEMRDGSEMQRNRAHVGDGLRFMMHGGRHQAIWVYLDDHDLVATCPGSTQCDSADGELTLELTMASLGQYSFIALTSAEPIPAPHGPLDAMLIMATTAGARFEIRYVDVN